MRMSSNSLAGSGGAAENFGHSLSGLGRALAAGVRHLWHAYWEHQARRATVRMLESLDDRLLKDIGIDRSEIQPAMLGYGLAHVRVHDVHRRRHRLP